MLANILNKMVQCEQCDDFANKDYPPLAPVRLADRVKIMFIGENPSWEFGQRVPFDGITNSGRALHEHYLCPLKKNFYLKESDFWITDLFKCRYPKDVYREKNHQQELIFNRAKTCATSWLIKEIKLAKPDVIVTLGNKEVYQRIRLIFKLGTPSNFKDVAYKSHPIEIGGHKCKLLPACHPDISFVNNRKPVPSQKWSRLHRAKFIKSFEGDFTPGST